MTATETPEYRELELASSNDIIRHDARRTDRKYPEAALHARNAGLSRLRMGELTLAAGDAPQAAADWLSAAACFYLATDLGRMSDALGRAQALVQAGKVPLERRDIHAALGERQAELVGLAQKLARFARDAQQHAEPAHGALAWLLQLKRELPGFPRLYGRIAFRARQSGDPAAAAAAIDWAEKFEPGSPHLAILRVQLLLDRSEMAEAAEAARALLTGPPEVAGTARFLLAQALAFRAGSSSADWQPTDWETALEVLAPLVAPDAEDTLDRLRGLALAVVLYHGIGNAREYAHALGDFDTLAGRLADPLAAELVAASRAFLPQVFLLPGRDPLPSPAGADYLAARNLFGQLTGSPVGVA